MVLIFKMSHQEALWENIWQSSGLSHKTCDWTLQSVKKIFKIAINLNLLQIVINQQRNPMHQQIVDVKSYSKYV